MALKDTAHRAERHTVEAKGGRVWQCLAAWEGRMDTALFMHYNLLSSKAMKDLDSSTRFSLASSQTITRSSMRSRCVCQFAFTSRAFCTVRYTGCESNNIQTNKVLIHNILGAFPSPRVIRGYEAVLETSMHRRSQHHSMPQSCHYCASNPPQPCGTRSFACALPAPPEIAVPQSRLARAPPYRVDLAVWRIRRRVQCQP